MLSHQVTKTKAVLALPPNILHPDTPVQSVLDLPGSLQVKIMRYLDPCTSMCVGLTCKKLWRIHRSRYTKVMLRNCIYRVEYRDADGVRQLEERISLFSLLRNWMGPGYTYSYWIEKYVRREVDPLFDFLIKENLRQKKQRRGKKMITC